MKSLMITILMAVSANVFSYDILDVYDIRSRDVTFDLAKKQLSEKIAKRIKKERLEKGNQIHSVERSVCKETQSYLLAAKFSCDAVVKVYSH